VPPWRLVYDIKRKCCGRALVPQWGLVYDIKKDVPPYPQVPPWGLVYDIKKDVPPYPPVPPWDWYMILKRMCFLQTLPTLSGASYPYMWLVIGMCKQLSIGA